MSWTTPGTKTISLEITTDDGCTASFEQFVDVTEMDLLMPTTLSINQGDSIEIAALASSSTADVTTYTWDNVETLSCSDCFNPTANPEESTTYTLTIEDADGCTTSESVLVNVFIPEPIPQLVVPNAFSPNNDGVNDEFRPNLDEMAVGMTMQIYNRWGKMVFETSDREAYWTGIYKDEFVPVGVYVYWILVEFSNGDTQLMTGNVTVVH